MVASAVVRDAVQPGGERRHPASSRRARRSPAARRPGRARRPARRRAAGAAGSDTAGARWRAYSCSKARHVAGGPGQHQALVAGLRAVGGSRPSRGSVGVAAGSGEAPAAAVQGGHWRTCGTATSRWPRGVAAGAPSRAILGAMSRGTDRWPDRRRRGGRPSPSAVGGRAKASLGAGRRSRRASWPGTLPAGSQGRRPLARRRGRPNGLIRRRRRARRCWCPRALAPGGQAPPPASDADDRRHWDDGRHPRSSSPPSCPSRCRPRARRVAGAGAPHGGRLAGVGARAGADRIAAEIAAPAAGAVRDRRPGRLRARDATRCSAASTRWSAA